MKRQGFAPIIVIMLIAAALAVGGGALYYSKKVRPQPSAPPLVAVTTTSTQDVTSNWKTYRNEQYGFEFKYPPNLNPQFNETFKESDLVTNRIPVIKKDGSIFVGMGGTLDYASHFTVKTAGENGFLISFLRYKDPIILDDGTPTGTPTPVPIDLIPFRNALEQHSPGSYQETLVAYPLSPDGYEYYNPFPHSGKVFQVGPYKVEEHIGGSHFGGLFLVDDFFAGDYFIMISTNPHITDTSIVHNLSEVEFNPGRDLVHAIISTFKFIR